VPANQPQLLFPSQRQPRPWRYRRRQSESPDGAAGRGEEKIGVIDLQKMQVIKRLPTAEKPNGSVYAVGFRKVYVSNTLGRAVAVVDVDKDEIVTTLRFK
jgi:DNA-binding beta-propeller fold protein YncE